MSSAPQRQDCHHSDAPRAGGNTCDAGLDFSLHMRRLCEDMVARVDRLRHIDMARVAVSFSQARKATSHGMYASLTPMRFAGGRVHTIRRGQKWGIQRLHAADGREMLYILNFYLPRFLDLRFREKLSTVMHELWHVGPDFDGDVRRYGGRCFVHGSSQQRYDAHAERLVDSWLASGPPESVCEFLRYDFHGLTTRYSRVYGRKIPTPKLIRVG
jgi:predicted metallopeptidase